MPDSPFRNRNGDRLELTDLYRGRECFLVCGGPSIKELPLDKLNQRGVLISSFNNCPSVLPPGVRPHIWTHSDKPIKFHEGLWYDSAVLKIVPWTMWGKPVYRRLSGNLLPSGRAAKDMACTIAYVRHHCFDPDTYLTLEAVCQGNDKKHAKVHPNGWPHIINTMFSMPRILYSLGIRTVYILGADFRMDVTNPYAFDQTKNREGVIEVNRHFRDMNGMFTALRPKFDAAGFQVFNCFEHSGLTAFPYKPFEECLNECRSHAAFPAKLDTAGWYDAKVVAK